MGILYITVFVFITMIASFSLSQVYAEPIIYDDDYIIEKFATGLQYPTTMYFVGDDILVLEKNTGKVIRISDNGVLYNEPALDVPVIQANESGLLGIVFASNHIYLYFTESLSGFDRLAHENSRNVVYQYDWDGEKLTNPILIKELPAIDTFHHGGVLTKGQNGEVYFVIGDQNQWVLSEEKLWAINEISSIFKIDTESDNSVELFAVGMRNSFGLAVDPVTGYLWETENGPSKFDEINLVKSRFNSGSNRVFGPADRIDFDLSTLNPKPFENFVYSTQIRINPVSRSHDTNPPAVESRFYKVYLIKSL
jgi:glucose/arabinose dehydrogenase